jgi:phosphonate transport system permease protein
MAQASSPLSLSPVRPGWFSAKGLWLLVAVAAIALSLHQAAPAGRAIINPGGVPQALRFLAASLNPELSPDFLALILRSTGITLAYAICGTSLSLVLGLVGGLLSAEISWRALLPQHPALGRWGWLTIRGLLAFPRAIHELIWGLFFINILGLDPLVAVLAIAVPFGAIVAKVFSEILDETPHGPLYALLNAGVAPSAAVLYGLLPQSFPNLLSYSFYRFECSLRSAAVLGVIGAGGLGYQILLSLESLRYEQLWTGFYALILLNGAVDTWSAVTRRRLGFTSRMDLGQPKKPRRQAPTDPRSLPGIRWFWLLGGLGIIALCFWSLDLGWARLFSGRTQQLFGEVMTSARPRGLSWDQVMNLGRLSGQTLAMSWLASVLATVGGILFSFPAAQNFLLPGGLLRPIGSGRGWPLWEGLVLGGTRLILLVSRAIPAPIWALVCLFVLFPGIWPGAVALAIHNFGILGRLMAEVNENLDDRPVRSLRALGAPAPQVVLYGILPQNLPRFLAYSLYRWEVCLRETVIVGLVGAAGLGRLVTQQLSSFDYSNLTLTLGAFVLLTFGVDLVSASVRRGLQ